MRVILVFYCALVIPVCQIAVVLSTEIKLWLDKPIFLSTTNLYRYFFLNYTLQFLQKPRSFRYGRIKNVRTLKFIRMFHVLALYIQSVRIHFMRWADGQDVLFFAHQISAYNSSVSDLPFAYCVFDFLWFCFSFYVNSFAVRLQSCFEQDILIISAYECGVFDSFGSVELWTHERQTIVAKTQTFTSPNPFTIDVNSTKYFK